MTSLEEGRRTGTTNEGSSRVENVRSTRRGSQASDLPGMNEDEVVVVQLRVASLAPGVKGSSDAATTAAAEEEARRWLSRPLPPSRLKNHNDSSNGS